MKPIRRTMTLLLFLLLACTASSASAATKKVSKTFTEVPTVKFTDTPRGTDSGDSDDLTISASLPGFLNLYLTDESGNVVLTIAKNLEIPSKTSTFDFYAIDDNGDWIEPGDYLFSADMVSQFGVASKTVTRKALIEEADEKPSVTSSALTTTVKGTVDTKKDSTDDSSSKTASKTEAKTEAKTAPKATAKPKATPVPEVLTYSEGKYAMGDEGLLIGVGVSDTATQSDAGYWGLKADASDAEIWAAITREMVGVDVGENESAYIYDSPESLRV